MPRFATLCLLSLVACHPQDGAPDDTDSQSSAQVALAGAVQKGPFVIGSSVSVSALDAQLAPTGAVFTTQTTNDRGEFALDVAATGPLQLEGTGFYYNEVTGALSQGNLTLRAFVVPDGSAQAQVYVNLLTHLTAGRVRALVTGGTVFGDAVAQAESEIVRELAISTASYVPGRQAIAMNVLGGDDDDNAYLLAVSAVLAQAGVQRAPGSADAELQALINGIAADLAPDGSIEASTRAVVAEAALALDLARMVSDFEARLAAIGSSAELPDVERVFDQDGDGLTNAVDVCDRVADDQADRDQDGQGDACDTCPDTACSGGCVPGHWGVADTCASPCGPDAACAPGTTCAVGVPWYGSTVDLCVPACDFATADCGPDATCMATVDSDEVFTGWGCVPRPEGVVVLRAGDRCEADPLACEAGLICADMWRGRVCATTCDTLSAGACGEDPCIPQRDDGTDGACPGQALEGEWCMQVEDWLGGDAVADTCGDGLACVFSDRCPAGPDSCCAPLCTTGCDADEACVSDPWDGGAEVCVEIAGLGEPCRYADECGPDAGCFDGAESGSSYLPGDCRAHCVDDFDCSGGEVCLATALDLSKVCALAP